MTLDKSTETKANDSADIISDWMNATGNGELGLLELVLFDQMVYRKSQRKPNQR
jgi:hypothetical protein